jgi:succinate dehydrogenase/fumarate reductase flavoprotein subunit
MTRPAANTSRTTTIPSRITYRNYVQGSWRNAANFKFNPQNWLNAALAGIDDGHNGGGPIWAVFDSDAVEREGWAPTPPANLEATVARYNSFVDSGVDEDFAKPKPPYKIAKPPFYAAWATPVVHDTRAGLRIDAKSRVIDMNGAVIPGLYCGGESAGGFSQHGLARAACQGYTAGREAAAGR